MCGASTRQGLPPPDGPPSSITASGDSRDASCHQSPEGTRLVLSTPPCPHTGSKGFSSGEPCPSDWPIRLHSSGYSDGLKDGDVTQAGPPRFSLGIWVGLWGKRTSLGPGVTRQVINVLNCELHESRGFLSVLVTAELVKPPRIVPGIQRALSKDLLSEWIIQACPCPRK